MARYRIKAPTNVTGRVVGVLFDKGVADGVEPSRQALAYFSRHAYRVTELDAPASVLADVEGPADSGGPGDEGSSAGGSGESADAPKRPAKSASKADWVAFAVAQGVPADEAEASTRDQLAERFAESEGDAK